MLAVVVVVWVLLFWFFDVIGFFVVCVRYCRLRLLLMFVVVVVLVLLFVSVAIVGCVAVCVH